MSNYMRIVFPVNQIELVKQHNGTVEQIIAYQLVITDQDQRKKNFFIKWHYPTTAPTGLYYTWEDTNIITEKFPIQVQEFIEKVRRRQQIHRLEQICDSFHSP